MAFSSFRDSADCSFNRIIAIAFLRTVVFSTMTFPLQFDVSGVNGSQESGVDITLLSVVGGDAGGFLVESDDDANRPLAGCALKAHPVAHVEAGQHGRTTGLADELEPIDNQAVKELSLIHI